MLRLVIGERQRDRVRDHDGLPAGHGLAGGSLGLRQQAHQRVDVGGASPANSSAIQSSCGARHRAERAPALGGEAHDLGAAVVRRGAAVEQALLDQALGEPGDVAVRHHHALRQLAERHAVRRLVELRHQVEARQGHVEAVAQPAAHLALDQRRAGEQPQPQAQFGLVVGRALRDLGLGIEDGAVVHQISPPATVSVVPVIALAPGEHR